MSDSGFGRAAPSRFSISRIGGSGVRLFGHCVAEAMDGLSDFPPHLRMCADGAFLASNVFPPNFDSGLRDAKFVGGKFGTTAGD